jgi:integrase
MMFNWGVQRGYIEKNPLAYWKRRVTPQKELTLTLEDINKIRAVAPPHTALGIEFVANTGVRPGPSELLALKWSNIQWEQSAVRVFAEKTQKWRTIPLKPEFLDKLRAEKELSNSDFIISFRDKQVSTIHHSFRLACRKVEVPDEVVLYDIRHWFCSTLLSQGVPVKTVSVLMGHASAKMTLDRYAHVIIGDADKAIAQLPSLG